MNLDKYNKVRANTPKDLRVAVNLNLDILDRINFLLKTKFNGKQKMLAERLGKSEAEISKWFCGYQNFTLETIAKLEIAFESRILGVIWDDNTEEKIDYVPVKCPMNSAPIEMKVNQIGEINEIFSPVIY